MHEFIGELFGTGDFVEKQVSLFDFWTCEREKDEAIQHICKFAILLVYTTIMQPDHYIFPHKYCQIRCFCFSSSMLHRWLQTSVLSQIIVYSASEK